MHNTIENFFYTQIKEGKHQPEHWIFIPDYFGKYMISNLGRVMKLTKSKHMSIIEDNDKKYVYLTKNNKTRKKSIKKLVKDLF